MSIGNAIGIFLLFWAAYLFLFTLPAAAMFYFGRKRAAWNTYGYLVAAAPYLIWITLFFSFPGRKDIGNVSEPLLLGLIAPAVLLVRLLYGKRRGYPALSIINLVGYCGFAVVMFFTTELIPE
jgi:hypothetical protein